MISGSFNTYEIKPEDFGFPRCQKDDLKGGTPQENAAVAMAIFSGAKGPKRDAVLLNAGAGLYIGGKAASLAEGVILAAQLVDSGAALGKLTEFIEQSNAPEGSA